MASSLQPNAIELEQKLAKLEQFNKASVNQTKMLQQVSRQQKETIYKLHEVIKRKEDELTLMRDRSISKPN